jgi:hypothetical protein
VSKGEHLGIIVGGTFREGNRSAEDYTALVVSDDAVSGARVLLGTVSEDYKLGGIFKGVDEEDIMLEDK